VPAVRAYYAEANSAPPDEDLMGFDHNGDDFPHADPLEGAKNCLAGLPAILGPSPVLRRRNRLTVPFGWELEKEESLIYTVTKAGSVILFR
jgi:hypothetical protein